MRLSSSFSEFFWKNMWFSRAPKKTGKMTLHLLQQTKILKCNLRNDSFSTHNETNGHFKMASNRFPEPILSSVFQRSLWNDLTLISKHLVKPLFEFCELFFHYMA